MDTFDGSSLGVFEQNGDANSFVDFFQQQQDQQQQQQQHPRSAGIQPSAGGLGDLTSPTSALLRSSASPTGRDQFAALHPDSASTTVDSPGSSGMATGSQQPQHQQNAFVSAAARAAAFTNNSLHPITATPVRHNSLPFDANRGAAAAAGMPGNSEQIARQMSMNAFASSSSSSSRPSSPNMAAAAATNRSVHPVNAFEQSPAMSSPSGSDFLNPNTSVSASPSPLRTSMPFTTSPDSTSTSPKMAKPDDGIGGGSGYAGNAGSRANTGLSQQGASATADGQGSSTKFVHKLFRMVSDPEYQHLISWNANGTSVVVTNFDEFAKEVLGKHFKHSNFSSFIRQLNMYGFYKVNKTPRGHRHTVDTQVWEFSHPKFIRGRPDLLDDIRRKALDSEHARVEARDLQYSVSVGHMQLRQQVDEQQFRLEEMFEMNMALRQMVLGLRDSLGNVLEWIKASQGGQLPFDARIPMMDIPPAPMIHPFMPERPPPPPWAGMPNPAALAAAAAAAAGGAAGGMLGGGGGGVQGDMTPGGGGDGGPSIYITEPGFFHNQAPPHSPHDVFSMGAMGQVSPMASRRVSSGSQASERMEVGRNSGPPLRMSIDTSMAAGMGNPGLGVMGLPQAMANGEIQMAINTPLPPSPNVQQHHGLPSGSTTPFGAHPGMDASPFLSASASFPGQAPPHQPNYFGTLPSPHSPTMHANGAALAGFIGGGGGGGGNGAEDGSMLGPNAKAMRTQMKRTASNSHQFALEAATAAANQQKRKSPGI